MNLELKSPTEMLAIIGKAGYLAKRALQPTSISNREFAAYMLDTYNIDYSDVRKLSREELMLLWESKRIWDCLLDFARVEGYKQLNIPWRKPKKGGGERLALWFEFVYKEEFNRVKAQYFDEYCAKQSKDYSGD